MPAGLIHLSLLNIVINHTCLPIMGEIIIALMRGPNVIIIFKQNGHIKISSTFVTQKSHPLL